MNLGIQRRKIEDRIIAHYEAIQFDTEQCDWIDTMAFEDFVFSFFELRRYYEKGDDVTIGLETIKVYMDALRALQAAAHNRDIPLSRQQSTTRLIYELNHQLEGVVYEVDRNRQNANPQNGGGGGVAVIG